MTRRPEKAVEPIVNQLSTESTAPELRVTPSLTQSNRTISPDQLVSPKSDILAQIRRKTGVAGAANHH